MPGSSAAAALAVGIVAEPAITTRMASTPTRRQARAQQPAEAAALAPVGVIAAYRCRRAGGGRVQISMRTSARSLGREWNRLRPCGTWRLMSIPSAVPRYTAYGICCGQAARSRLAAASSTLARPSDGRSGLDSPPTLLFSNAGPIWAVSFCARSAHCRACRSVHSARAASQVWQIGVQSRPTGASENIPHVEG
jgi:hypothetical protein